MSDADRLAEILSAVRDELAKSDSDEPDVDSDEAIEDLDLGARASEVRDIVEHEPGAAVDAVGLGESFEDDKTESIPAAIARGSPDQVRELRAIAQLASLADESGASDSEVAALAETLGSADGRSDESTADEPADEGSGLEQLLSTAGDDVEALGDELDSLKNRLVDLRDDGAESEAEDSADSEVEADDGDVESGDVDAKPDDAEESEREEDAADEDGFLGDTLSGADDSAGQSSRHSTIPSSDRADMRAVRRHSTMPRRE
ncbi:hypothetical protein OB905_13025 [Halobacteria archaeon AArc-dxtr1]|nr:hypothetical protein [Halobacteria archaeon AArc-dxtr1]